MNRYIGVGGALHGHETIYVTLAVGLLFLTLNKFTPSLIEALLRKAQGRIALAVFAALIFGTVLGLLVMDGTCDGFLSFVEPNIASVAWLVGKGAPLYPPARDATRYSLVYGPMAYLPYTAALLVLGGSIVSLKVVVGLSHAAIWVTLTKSYRRLTSLATSLLVVAIVAAWMLTSATYLLEARGDVLIIASVGVGLYAALCVTRRWSILLFALAAGVCGDIKFTGLFYLLPILVLLGRRHGAMAALQSAMGATIVAAVPFACPNISFSQYVQRIELASHHRFDWNESLYTCKTLVAIFVASALLMLRLGNRCLDEVWCHLRRNWLFLLTLGTCLILVAVPSGTVGAGPHHMLPFYPVIGYAWLGLYQDGTSARGAARRRPASSLWYICWLGVALFVAVGIKSQLIALAQPLTERRRADDVTRDIQVLMLHHPGSRIEMGYSDRIGAELRGGPYELTYYRPALVFAGNPLTVDACAIEDMQLSGSQVPFATVEYLGQCRTKIWLIPKDGQPFVMPSALTLLNPQMFPNLPLFSPAFRQTFLQRYHKAEVSKYFDLWTCEDNVSVDANKEAAGEALQPLAKPPRFSSLVK